MHTRSKHWRERPSFVAAEAVPSGCLVEKSARLLTARGVMGASMGA